MRMTEQPRDTSALLEALRATVAAAPTPLHPSQLRLLVEEALGPERSRDLRREIHQVVVAAEEHLPMRMTRISPLTASSLANLSSELAAARGWSPQTAERATRTWAAALGHDHLAVTDWPPAAQVEHVASRPPASTTPAVDETALPPQPTPVVAGRDSRNSATEVAWPKPNRRLRKVHERSTAGEPVLGVVQTYAGIPLPAFAAATAVVLIGLTVALVVTPPVGWAIAGAAGALAARGLTSAAKFGALAATSTGLEHVPYVLNMRRPKFDQAVSAPWSQVRTEVGSVSVVEMAGRRIQVGPRNRAFAEAVAELAGGRA
jgi:hypothetical protein